ncbi:hypothetical protein AAAT57_10085 [Bifidobacterium longum]
MSIEYETVRCSNPNCRTRSFQLDRLHTATTRMEAGTQTGHTGYHRP